ncbi:Berberine bridge enzyme-like 23 [Linum perenne]
MRYFNSTSRPHFISTPSHHSDIQAAILCAKQEGLQIRVRSGGHDYEGLSYLGSGNPYIIIDLTNLNNVQSGAQLGELYYGIAKQSSQYNSGSPLEVLLDKTQMYKAKFKAKSDFVTDPVPEFGLEGMWKLAVEEELSIIILEPLGGRMKEIPESYTPFPHRIGHLYNIQYLVKWEEDNDEEEEKRHIEWMKKLYDYMEAYVSKSPRAAYLNYRDLDIGTNNVDERKTSFMEASVWGKKYFRDNFIKLCKAKTMIDPHNFFSHEQSIPLFH